MNKLFLLLTFVIAFLGCNNLSLDQRMDLGILQMIQGHEVYYADFGDFSDEKPIDEKIKDIVSVMNKNMVYQSIPNEQYILPNPQVIWERGYGDCDQFAIVLMNILYVELGMKPQFVATNILRTRSVVEGGEASHAAIYLNGKVYEPQTGQVVDYTVNYTYSFEEVFSADF